MTGFVTDCYQQARFVANDSSDSQDIEEHEYDTGFEDEDYVL